MKGQMSAAPQKVEGEKTTVLLLERLKTLLLLPTAIKVLGGGKKIREQEWDNP